MGFALMQAARGLRRDLGANALVIAVLSVGIASVLIIFSFVKALMIDPPPFANAAHVVKLGFDAPDVNGDTYQANPSGADLLVSSD